MKSLHSISATTTSFSSSKSFCISFVTSSCKMRLISSSHHASSCSEWLFNKTTRRRMLSDILKRESTKWKCSSWNDFRNLSISISLKKYEQYSNDEFINVDSNSQTKRLSWERWERNERHWIKRRLKISLTSCHVAFRRSWLQMKSTFTTEHNEQWDKKDELFRKERVILNWLEDDFLAI